MTLVPSGETLGELYERNLVLYRDRPALVFEGRSFTYGEFIGRAHRLANALHAGGLKRQDRVAILAQNSHEHLEAFAAAEITGFIAVAVNYRLAPPEVRFILGDAAPRVLIFDSEYAGLIEAIRGELGTIERFICIPRDGHPAPDWAEPFETVLESASDAAPALRARPDDIAYIMYTSGTTGLPKGAMLGHREQICLARGNTLILSARPSDRMLLVMPLYHIGAKCTHSAVVMIGATAVLHRSYDVTAIARDIEANRITVGHLAPLMVNDLISLPDIRSYDHASLRLVLYASGPMAVAQLRRAVETYGHIFVQVYGMTESGPGTVLYPDEHVLDGTEREQRRLSSAGKPSPGCAVRVIRDDGSECEPEELGEVLLGGPGIMRGYWNRHPASIDTREDGWLHTGDVGLMDGDGFLYILDRKKDMIISGGENIYPREVEEAIYAHPAVLETAVIGVPDERWGEAVKAFVVLRDGQQATGDDIVAHCRTRIASYKKPKSVEFIAALPRLPNKKIDKKALRAPHWKDRARNVN